MNRVYGSRLICNPRRHSGAANRLTDVTSSSTGIKYFYRGDGLRIKSDDGTDTMQWYYSAVGMTLEQKNGSDYAAWVPGLAITSTDGVFYYLRDIQRNVLSIIGEDGNADWYSYDPYGHTISEPASPNYNPFRYKGAYQDIVNGTAKSFTT